VVGVIVALLAAWVSPAGAAEAEKLDVVTGSNAFALELYAKLAAEKERAGKNLFFSPFSISTALAMTYAGARGDTEAQMAKALHFDDNEEPFHDAFGELVRRLNALGKKRHCQLSVANALWAQKDYRFLRSFTDLVTESYQAGLNTVDFSAKPEVARRTINRWVEDRTQKKIKDLLARGALSPDTRLVLTNAVYFNGDWASPFEKRWTREAPFYLAVPKGYRGPVKTVEVPLMQQADSFRYADLGTFKILEMPYKGEELSMVLLLPKEYHTEAMAALEGALTPANLAKWLRGAAQQEVIVFLPRFKMTCEFMLEKTLSAMGMADAFTQGLADLSGMDGKRCLFISAVVHKAFVETNEKGTEAAAATAVPVPLCAPPGEHAPPPVFRADRPFVFLIRETRSGSILFLGRVTNPKFWRPQRSETARPIHCPPRSVE